MTGFEPHLTENPIISSPSTLISAPSFLNHPNLLGGNFTADGPELPHFDEVMPSHGGDGHHDQERTLTADHGD